MKNFVQTGDTLTFTAPAPVVSGQGVTMGALFGVATTSAAAGVPFEAALSGVYVLPKAADNIAAGAALYWDAAEGQVTTDDDDGANRLVGAATENAGTSAATVPVRLNSIAA
ncbi:DUF2190 family protein [Rhodovulum strictum]|uniref:DUF2190 family protein n=1 Tax=Rhodovulum strictum TaxID=58314 RepID=A0A844B8L1_9RHOB|nr:capsid cement protein [Rhodovulum strictum]MRH22641.1 DUF2190 family protein [Rhodovulum strictum]